MKQIDRSDAGKLFGLQHLVNDSLIGLTMVLSRGVLAPSFRLHCLKLVMSCLLQCNRLCDGIKLDNRPDLTVLILQEHFWKDLATTVLALGRVSPAPRSQRGNDRDPRS